METTSRQTQFQNTPALHERAKTYSALSFDRITFSTQFMLKLGKY